MDRAGQGCLRSAGRAGWRGGRRGERSASRVACAFAAFGLVALVIGCDKKPEVRSVGTDLSNASLATLDVRGGDVVTSKQVPPITTAFGQGGPAGRIRVESSVGNISITESPPALLPPIPVLAGAQNLHVRSGQTLAIKGSHTVDYILVDAGGTLVLHDDTLLRVVGDVDVSGTVVSNRKVTSGYDLTILAGGIVRITGRIDLSGRDNVRSDDMAALGGGNGGELHIAAGGTAQDNGRAMLWVSGVIDTRGGNADAVSSLTVSLRAGRGGRIFLGSHGSASIAGKLIACAGRKGFNDVIDLETEGGEIHIVALSDVEIANAAKISAVGGSSVGINAGTGGTIEVLAPMGEVRVRDTNLLASGGDATHSDASSAGSGGSVSVYGLAMRLEGSIVDASGGQPARVSDIAGRTRVRAVGGNGGEVWIVSSDGMAVERNVMVRAMGGDTLALEFPRGVGGKLSIINLDETNPAKMQFRGACDARGGSDAIGNRLNDGVICCRGGQSDSIDAMTAGNQFPVASCAGDPLEGPKDIVFAIHDLDCLEETLYPQKVEREIPVVTGIDFFRVHVPAGATSVKITTSAVNGEQDIDLYADDSDGFLDPPVLDTAQYAFASETRNSSSETLEIPIAPGFAPGVITVLVVEKGPFVERYEINVDCSEN